MRVCPRGETGWWSGGALLTAAVLCSCITQVEKKIPYAVSDTGAEGVAQDVLDEPPPVDTVLDLLDTEEFELADDASDVGPDPDVPSDLKPVEQGVLGPKGGRLLFEGGVLLEVPEGALSGPVQFEVLKFVASPPENTFFVSDSWAVLPGGTAFALPITLTLPRGPAPVTAEEWLRLKGYVAAGQVFDGTTETVPASGRIDGNQVSLQTMHLSMVAVGVGPEASPVCLDYELCNGKDDNCNGQTDEGLTDPALSNCKLLGVCQGQVQAACVDGNWQCTYTSPHYEEEETSCDEMDNDCDGSTDEGIFGSADDYPEAGCRRLGVCQAHAPFAFCAAGQWICNYSAVPLYEGPVESSCDGYDNNCDGTVDEGACRAFFSCADSFVCRSGNCVSPLNDSSQTRCTVEPDGCLASDGLGGWVEVATEGTRCVDETTVHVCQDGIWSQATTCSQILGSYALCNLETHACDEGCETNEDCEDDGNKCNGVPICVDGSCVLDPGSVVKCTHDACNIYICVPSTGLCIPSPANQGKPCEDADPCTLTGVCQAGTCVIPGPVVCDDSNDCTADSCNPDNGQCVFDPGPKVGDSCDDNDPCTVTDVCIGGGTCLGQQKVCDDGNECTVDSCDPFTGNCLHASEPQEGEDCEDGDLCTLGDICAGGLCLGVPAVCNDKNDCTADFCDGATGLCAWTGKAGGLLCMWPVADSALQDPCIPWGVCNGQGVCLPGLDTCQCRVNADCLPLDNGNLCDGYLVCNTQEAPYRCVFEPDTVVECDDSEDTDCRKNLCDPVTGSCQWWVADDEMQCDDRNVCTLEERCVEGVCVPRFPLDCDDGEPCTAVLCDPVSGCANPPLEEGTPCDDEDPCSRDDQCVDGSCISDAILECDDSDPCTVDTCTPEGLECLFLDIPNCCVTTGDCNVGAGQICYDRQCCTRYCGTIATGFYACGDDGCGGSCGTCSSGRVCHLHACCTPECAGRQCGDNACGGTCGVCQPGQVCTAGGQCCTPACTGKTCGSDGCGGVCGTCPAGMICNKDTWGCEVCTPNCAGRQCGSDGCEGSCGTCGSGKVCTAAGTCCTPNCTGRQCGDDGCGGSCGGCQSWQMCDLGQCVCNGCCSTHAECLWDELCLFNVGATTCTEVPALFYRGFETDSVGSIPSAFEYSWQAFQNYFKVQRNTDGSISNSGVQSLMYYNFNADQGTMKFKVRLPDQADPTLAMLSFHYRCSLGAAAAWSMTLRVGTTTLATFGPGNCINGNVRYTYDLSAKGQGISEISWTISKPGTGVVRFYLDDIEVLVEKCIDTLPCVDFKAVNGLCEVDSIIPSGCYIDMSCYNSGQYSPLFPCGQCQPAVNQRKWTPNHQACNDGNPATQDVCSEATQGCTHN